MGIVASEVLTYYWLKLIDMPCLLCVELHAYKRLIAKFSIQRNHVPMACSGVSCSGRRYSQISTIGAWSFDSMLHANNIHRFLIR